MHFTNIYRCSPSCFPILWLDRLCQSCSCVDQSQKLVVFPKIIDDSWNVVVFMFHVTFVLFHVTCLMSNVICTKSKYPKSRSWWQTEFRILKMRFFSKTRRRSRCPLTLLFQGSRGRQKSLPDFCLLVMSKRESNKFFLPCF